MLPNVKGTKVSKGDCDIDFSDTLTAYNGSAKNIILPDGIKVIGEDAFFGNKQITAVAVPVGVETIEDGAFWMCLSLKNVVLPSTLRKIGENAFNSCVELTSIMIPEGVVEIGANAFTNCKKLKDIHVPNSATDIGDDAFYTFNESTLIHTSNGSTAEIIAKEHDWKVDNNAEPSTERVEPLQKTSRQIMKNSKINAPDTLEAQEFSTVSPSKNLYWHYDMLLNQKRGGLSRFAEVSINDSGTEFTCLDLDTVVPEDEYLEKVTFAADADRCNYRCHKAALEMSRVFRVAPNAFNYLHDREGEIREKTMRRAYNFSALRSFAWTLGAYQETEGLDEEQISIDVLLQLGEFVKSRDWLNYTDKSHYNGLCDGGDLLMFYLPDKTTPYLVKENVVEKDNVVSLDNLRNDLSALEPIMRQIHEHLHKNRERSQPLSTPLSDVLYAWCVLALAAEKAFFTEDGPMSCDYSQYND